MNKIIVLYKRDLFEMKLNAICARLENKHHFSWSLKASARFPTAFPTRARGTPCVLKTWPEMTYAQRAQHLTASLKHSSFARARL